MPSRLPVVRSLGLALCVASLTLWSPAAQAAGQWAITLEPGSVAVMVEISALRFRITNTSTGSQQLKRFRLGFDPERYEVAGVTPPPGWAATTD